MLAQIASRLMRMVTLQTDVYPEVRDDPAATWQAALIVAVASILWGIGVGSRTSALLGILLGPLVLWLLWTSVAWLLGTRAFGGSGSWLGLARVLGYAAAPFGLAIFGLLPCGGLLVAPLSWAIAAVLGVLGVRETLELSTERAIVTVLIALLIIPVALGIVALAGLDLY